MMESSVNPGMCRCCASEGAFKDIKSTYHWMGEEEIYADMLRECFDIILNASEQGQDGGICEVCITQLRNAINFKKQVLHTEDQFQKHLQNKTLFRPHIVKVEVHGDEDSDDNMGSGDDAFSGAEFEVPIKTEVDDPKPKKRAAAKAPATTTRASAKKAKADNGETSTKRLGCDTDIRVETDVSKILKAIKAPRSAKANDNKSDWKSSDQAFEEDLLRVRPHQADDREIDKHLQNIRNILFYSNATPIRKHTGNNYLCGFCSEQFTIPGDLKTHTLQTHDNETKSSFMNGCAIFNYVVRLDITGLKCEICDLDIDGLESLMNHLKSDHYKIIHTDIKNYILCFKFEGDTLQCALCPNTYEHFKVLLEHMNVHNNNFNCEICSAPFVNKRTLRSHTRRHKQGEFSCSFCSKVFNTNIRKLCHERFTHVLDQKRNKCPHCNEKFVSYTQRNEHMVKEHGAEPLVLKCKACDKTFSSKENLTRHTKRDHLLERRHECEHCDMKFYRKIELNMHMLKHTRDREYSCDICLKDFGRKYHLQQHLRIHADDRKYRCNHCGLPFVQKASWRNHMRTRHNERV